MNNISLVLATYQPDLKMLNRALECIDLFNEVIVHVNQKDNIILPQKCQVIYREEKCSVQEALNECISLAKSSWILPWTDDDFFHNINLAYLLNLIKTQDIQKDVIHYPIFAGNDKDGWRIWGNNPIIRLDRLKEENLIPFSSVYKKSVWEKVGGYKQGEYSDWAFWCEVVKKECSFYYLNNPVYYHREAHKETLANKESRTYNKELFLKKLGL
jgi:hypothetical protein